MLSVTVDEIQRDPSKYLRQVEAGETFVIVQADKAIAVKLVRN
jgi:antitoxin (DNA-binding transcriptional repressor) of toxin-antitoxin stability system